MKQVKNEIDAENRKLDEADLSLNVQQRRLELEEEVAFSGEDDHLGEEMLHLRRQRLIRKRKEIDYKRQALTSRLIKSVADMTEALSQDFESLVTAKVVGLVPKYHNSADLEGGGKARTRNETL